MLGVFVTLFPLTLVWDVAAGIVIVKEAGGTVTDFKGGEKYIEDGSAKPQ